MLAEANQELVPVENADSSSDTSSDISLSEKIVLESNEKRLRQKMSSLQNSIMNLKEQLKQEKEMWKEDIERIRNLSQCVCLHQPSSSGTSLQSREGSYYNLCKENSNHKMSIHKLLELQNYKRKLAETENMCNLELSRVKQSLQNLVELQNIASSWGKSDYAEIQPSIEEIFVKQKAIE